MKPIAFRPIGARYLVLPDDIKGESEQIGEYTIAREQNIHEKSTVGTVIARGTTCTEPLNPGDKVSFGKFSGYEQIVDGKSYIILQESELLGEIVRTPFDHEPSLPLTMGNLV